MELYALLGRGVPDVEDLGLVEKGILSDNHGIRRPTDLLFMLWLKDF